MTFDELKKALEHENERHATESKRIKLQFAKSNSSVVKDQIIEDHIGKINVEDIKFSIGDIPQCVYYGPELDKKGNFKTRRGQRVYRSVWQCNLKKS